jgi:hypothetical protein
MDHKVAIRPPRSLLTNALTLKSGCITVAIGRMEEAQECKLRGMLLYWHNVLIESYLTVGGGASNPDDGIGVIGISDLSHCKVEHNKQRFLVRTK